MNTDTLKALTKTEISQKAKTLTELDVKFLVETLSEKDDKIRYNAFLLLKEKSRQTPLVYPYWDILTQKLESNNSYQRSLGLMLISENVRWDSQGKFTQTIGRYLDCCLDEKFVTSRQATQGLAEIIASTDKYNQKIKQKLDGLTLAQYPENQQRLLAKDIANVMKLIGQKTKITKQR
jgi:hypothetical protein